MLTWASSKFMGSYLQKSPCTWPRLHESFMYISIHLPLSSAAKFGDFHSTGVVWHFFRDNIYSHTKNKDIFKEITISYYGTISKMLDRRHNRHSGRRSVTSRHSWVGLGMDQYKHSNSSRQTMAFVAHCQWTVALLFELSLAFGCAFMVLWVLFEFKIKIEKGLNLRLICALI